jgi:hypothetical protein
LIETEKVAPVIDRTFPLSEVPDAIRYLRAGQAHGKIVVTCRPSNGVEGMRGDNPDPKPS